MALVDFFKKIEPDKEKNPIRHTLYDALFTFAFTPNTVTKGGTHIKDGMDLKRTMFHVVIALQLCFLFGTYNVGHQHFVALGEHLGFFHGFHLKLAYGLCKLLPIFVVANVVGLGIEIIYAAKRHHAVEEGFLVSGALIPMIMPPDIPLGWLALSIVFAVILGKEAFGGTGMNIWNVALLSRVFIFFAYPTTISGDEVWVAGLESTAAGSLVDYGWWQTGFFNWIFEGFGWDTFNTASTVVDGYTGATPMILAANGIAGTDLVGWEAVTSVYSESQLWWGAIPGSIGETCKPFIIVGAIFLAVTKIASWRIMISMLIGAAVTAMAMDASGLTPFMDVPWYYQFYMGSFFFAMAFMATDPVTASGTKTGKWIYGFMIGMVGMIIRVLNPAYPEGWMLAILLLNTFSAAIDNYVLKPNISKRLQRA